ncbi:MAG: leukotoxin LktA family filamentous adhesin, partial [Alphaproteobacteria bacterium]|nr:leukotoxin LktA family filamentous adhesin [Alphaproteobacteria bacterium]
MPKAARNKKIQNKKSQEIVFKKPSLFRKVVSFVTAYSMMFLNITPVFATNITGVAGNNGVYNIDAAKVSGSTGFRQYTDFTLDNGDVANLKFDQGYNKFVNMVDNQVNINGIVNTVKGEAFYNGHAIFVSPNGIVVGASGVLNVGSLTMATPRQDTYDDLKRAYNGRVTYDIADYEHGAEKYNELLQKSEGMITVNGRIMAKENVELY